MTLPIDPSQVNPEDIGEKQTTLEMGHEEAIEHVREVFADAGFGVPVEFSPSEMLKEKIDAGRDPYYVLGACNPEMADRALDATDNKLGALMACNVVIWEEEPGLQRVYHVSIMRIARLLGMSVDDEAIDDIIADTGELVDEAFAQLSLLFVFDRERRRESLGHARVDNFCQSHRLGFVALQFEDTPEEPRQRHVGVVQFGRSLLPVVGECRTVVGLVGHQPLAVQPLEHLGHRRRRRVQQVGDGTRRHRSAVALCLDVHGQEISVDTTHLRAPTNSVGSEPGNCWPSPPHAPSVTPPMF
jgi:uncharacterized protein (DUF302 family)